MLSRIRSEESGGGLFLDGELNLGGVLVWIASWLILKMEFARSMPAR